MLALPVRHQLARDLDRLRMTHRLARLEAFPFHAGLAVTEHHDHTALCRLRHVVDWQLRLGLLRTKWARRIGHSREYRRTSRGSCDCDRSSGHVRLEGSGASVARELWRGRPRDLAMRNQVIGL